MISTFGPLITDSLQNDEDIIPGRERAVVALEKVRRSESKEQKSAPTKHEKKLKLYTPAKEATKNTDEVHEIQCGAL